VSAECFAICASYAVGRKGPVPVFDSMVEVALQTTNEVFVNVIGTTNVEYGSAEPSYGSNSKVEEYVHHTHSSLVPLTRVCTLQMQALAADHAVQGPQQRTIIADE
jgi:hypothetical protein